MGEGRSRDFVGVRSNSFEVDYSAVERFEELIVSCFDGSGCRIDASAKGINSSIELRDRRVNVCPVVVHLVERFCACGRVASALFFYNFGEFGDSSKGLFEVFGQFVDLTRLGDSSIFNSTNAAIEIAGLAKERLRGGVFGRCNACCKVGESSAGSCHLEVDPVEPFGEIVGHSAAGRRVEHVTFKRRQSSSHQLKLRTDLDNAAILTCALGIERYGAGCGTRDLEVCGELWPRYIVTCCYLLLVHETLIN